MLLIHESRRIERVLVSPLDWVICRHAENVSAVSKFSANTLHGCRESCGKAASRLHISSRSHRSSRQRRRGFKRRLALSEKVSAIVVCVSLKSGNRAALREHSVTLVRSELELRDAKTAGKRKFSLLFNHKPCFYGQEERAVQKNI